MLLRNECTAHTIHCPTQQCEYLRSVYVCKIVTESKRYERGCVCVCVRGEDSWLAYYKQPCGVYGRKKKCINWKDTKTSRPGTRERDTFVPVWPRNNGSRYVNRSAPLTSVTGHFDQKMYLPNGNLLFLPYVSRRFHYGYKQINRIGHDLKFEKSV